MQEAKNIRSVVQYVLNTKSLMRGSVDRNDKVVFKPITIGNIYAVDLKKKSFYVEVDAVDFQEVQLKAKIKSLLKNEYSNILVITHPRLINFFKIQIIW